MSKSVGRTLVDMLTPVWEWAPVLLALDLLATYLNTLRAYLVALTPVTATIALALA